jgi:excisionase family DNA binding protein
MVEKILMELCEIKHLLQLNKEVFTLKEFCQYADLSEEHAYKLTRMGKLKFYRPFGKRIYIKKQDAIEALLQNPINAQGDIDRLSNQTLFTSKIAA